MKFKPGDHVSIEGIGGATLIHYTAAGFPFVRIDDSVFWHTREGTCQESQLTLLEPSEQGTAPLFGGLL